MSFEQRLGGLFVELQARGNVTDVMTKIQSQLATTQQLAGTTSAQFQKLFQLKSTDMSEALKLQLNFTRELAKFTGSSEGKRFAQEQLGMMREMARVQRDITHGPVGSVGRLGADMGDALGRLNAAAQIVERRFNQATSAITHTVQAASPQTWATFTGSLELLSAVVGQQFVPYVIQASQWIQNLVHRIDEMDDGTKRTIARWVMLGVGIAGTIVVIAKVSAVIRDASAATSLLTSGLVRATGAMIAFAAANPVTAVLALTAAVAAGVTVWLHWGRTLDDITWRLQRLESLRERLASGGPMSERDFAEAVSPEVRQRLQQAPNDTERQRILEAERNRLEGEVRRLQGGMSEEAVTQREVQFNRFREAGEQHIPGAGMVSSGLNAEIMGLRPGAIPEYLARNAGRFLGQHPEDTEAGIAIARSMGGHDQGRIRQAALIGTEPLSRHMTELAAVQNAIQNGVPGGRSFLHNAQFQSQFLSIEQQRDRIQQAGASLSPIQEQILQRQREMFTQLVQGQVFQVNQVGRVPGTLR